MNGEKLDTRIKSTCENLFEKLLRVPLHKKATKCCHCRTLVKGSTSSKTDFIIIIHFLIRFVCAPSHYWPCHFNQEHF